MDDDNLIPLDALQIPQKCNLRYPAGTTCKGKSLIASPLHWILHIRVTRLWSKFLYIHFSNDHLNSTFNYPSKSNIGAVWFWCCAGYAFPGGQWTATNDPPRSLLWTRSIVASISQLEVCSVNIYRSSIAWFNLWMKWDIVWLFLPGYFAYVDNNKRIEAWSADRCLFWFDGNKLHLRCSAESFLFSWIMFLQTWIMHGNPQSKAASN